MQLQPAYEIMNPSFRDMNLEQQIKAGINNWCAEGHNGEVFFGETCAKVEPNRFNYYN